MQIEHVLFEVSTKTLGINGDLYKTPEHVVGHHTFSLFSAVQSGSVNQCEREVACAKLEGECLLGRNHPAKGERDMACSAQRTTGLWWQQRIPIWVSIHVIIGDPEKS